MGGLEYVIASQGQKANATPPNQGMELTGQKRNALQRAKSAPLLLYSSCPMLGPKKGVQNGRQDVLGGFMIYDFQGEEKWWRVENV